VIVPFCPKAGNVRLQVGQKDQALVVFGIEELDEPQVLRVIFAGLRGDQHNGLIATQSSGIVHGARIIATTWQIGFATNDKERFGLMESEPRGEISEVTIRD